MYLPEEFRVGRVRTRHLCQFAIQGSNAFLVQSREISPISRIIHKLAYLSRKVANRFSRSSKASIAELLLASITLVSC
jgi:hypothetical protein